MVMLGNKSSSRASSRSARLSSSISHTVSTRRQRPAAKTILPDRPKLTRKTFTKSKNPSPRKSAKTNRLALERKKLTWPEYSLLGILGASCLCIATTFITVANFDPARDAENALASLARDYYLEFLYPRTLGSQINEPAAILSKYTESGLPAVRLSQILLYNDGSHSSYTSYFDNKYYKCDIGRSYLNFYPTAPYGPRDFTVEYATDCEKVL